MMTDSCSTSKDGKTMSTRFQQSIFHKQTSRRVSSRLWVTSFMYYVSYCSKCTYFVEIRKHHHPPINIIGLFFILDKFNIPETKTKIYCFLLFSDEHFQKTIGSSYSLFEPAKCKVLFKSVWQILFQCYNHLKIF